MDDQKMRASDADRQRVIDCLRSALGEGRLELEEFLDRMGRAAEAVTYGDLAALYADLPVTGTVLRLESAMPAVKRSQAGATGGLPAAIRLLWTIWAAAVSVNLVVWVLVCATTAQLVYPWPLWVACPLGAALLIASACAADGRRRAGWRSDGQRQPERTAVTRIEFSGDVRRAMRGPRRGNEVAAPETMASWPHHGCSTS